MSRAGPGRTLNCTLGRAAAGKLWAVLIAAALPQTTDAQCQVSKLTASDLTQNVRFGTSVSISGEWAVVGAPLDAEFDPPSGAVYMFQRTGSSWIQTQKLQGSDAISGAQFGFSVAIEGTTAVIGAKHESPQGVSAAGAAYVFELQGTTWTQTAKIWAASAHFDGHFGWSVAVEGGLIVVGARDDWTNGTSAGAAFVFERAGSTWTQTATLIGDDTSVFDFMGGSVHLCGDLVIVGAVSNNGPAGDLGAAYIFERSGSTWDQAAKLIASDAADGDSFGQSVVITSAHAIVGATGQDGGGSNSGAVYVFERQADSWVETQQLQPIDGSAGDAFGADLSIAGDLALVSASNDSDGVGNLVVGYGSVYSLRRVASQWLLRGKLVARDAFPSSGDGFGASIALWQATAFIGCPSDDDACPTTATCNSGSAYVFELAPDAIQYGDCVASAPCANTDFHGGCRSSVGRGGELAAAGSSSVTADELYFHALRLPANKSAIVFMGGAQGVATLGDGLKVVSTGSSGIRRFHIQQSDATGFLALGPGIIALQNAVTFTAGDVWNFQCWYRDPTGPCTHGTNLTNGVQVTFTP